MINQKNKGFTLIELLVVVAIIAILSVVVISAINSAREKGKDSSAMSQMNQARNQAEIYYTKYGNYIGLCDQANTLESGRQGIYDFVLEATKVIGFEDPESYVVWEQTNGVYPDNQYYYNVGKSRCRVSGKILEPLWAAHVPLLKKSKSGLQQYYCVDSTGAGMVTTVDFASAQGSLEKKYLGCVPSLE
jgi:prepilin-type N-terminal cleavage/methylation domain-containing protein